MYYSVEELKIIVDLMGEVMGMTIDDAIKHADEIASLQEEKASQLSKKDQGESTAYKECMKCAMEHRLLAGWLRELKDRRDK